MDRKIDKILYATDLSKNSAYAFRYAVDCAEKNHAKIIILHVREDFSATTKMLMTSYLNEEQIKKLHAESEDYTHERIKKRRKVLCEKELKSEIELTDMIEGIKVKEGFPAEIILQSADELDVDLIIMGTNSKGFIENTFLGSTAKRVLRRTHKPIFIVPIPRGEIDISVPE